jgi:hypothetical protein
MDAAGVAPAVMPGVIETETVCAISPVNLSATAGALPLAEDVGACQEQASLHLRRPFSRRPASRDSSDTGPYIGGKIRCLM